MAQVIDFKSERMKRLASKVETTLGYKVSVTTILLSLGAFALCVILGLVNMALGEVKQGFAVIGMGFGLAFANFVVVFVANYLAEEVMLFQGDPGEFSGGGGDPPVPAPLSFNPFLGGFLTIMTLVFGVFMIDLFEDGEAAILDSIILFLIVLLIAVLRSKSPIK